MILNEDQVKNAVVAWLIDQGYGSPRIKTQKEHGPDIRVRHTKYARYFIVEAKGEPENARNPRSGREVRFLQSLGQLVTRIQPRRGYYYGLAYPRSYQSLVIRRLYPALLKALKIHLLFVDDKLRVQCLKWRDATRLRREQG